MKKRMILQNRSVMSFVNKVDRSQLPEGIKFELK